MEFNTARKEIEKPSFKYFYIEEFDDDNKLFEVLSEMPNIEEYHHKKLGVNKDINKVNPELRQFYCEPLLNKQQEYHLFRKLNFFKYKAHRYYNWYCRSKLSKNKNLFVEYLKKAHDVRNLLVCCNTRLAAQVYKKRKDLYGDAVDNLLSDCFANIIRAADGFDFRRGFKFSTYCTWVLMNNSLRDYQQDKKFTDMFATNIEDIGSNETGDSEAIEKDLQQEKVISMQKDIFDICNMSITKSLQFFQNLPKSLNKNQLTISDRLLKEITERLYFLNNVGIGYLNLNRSAGTLSGGESQRIRLASQIGSGLTGVLYVLGSLFKTY